MLQSILVIACGQRLLNRTHLRLDSYFDDAIQDLRQTLPRFLSKSIQYLGVEWNPA